MRITKLKWKWIKFWGHRYLMISPLKVKYLGYPSIWLYEFFN